MCFFFVSFLSFLIFSLCGVLCLFSLFVRVLWSCIIPADSWFTIFIFIPLIQEMIVSVDFMFLFPSFGFLLLSTLCILDSMFNLWFCRSMFFLSHSLFDFGLRYFSRSNRVRKSCDLLQSPILPLGTCRTLYLREKQIDLVVLLMAHFKLRTHTFEINV